jgi:hypothetical protein
MQVGLNGTKVEEVLEQQTVKMPMAILLNSLNTLLN